MGIIKSKMGRNSANSYYDVKIEKSWRKADDLEGEYLRLKTEETKPLKSFKNPLAFPDVSKISKNLAPTINRKMSPILHAYKVPNEKL